MRRIPVAIFLAKDSALCCVVLTAYRFVMTHVWRVFPASLPLLSTRHKLYVFLRWGIRVTAVPCAWRLLYMCIFMVDFYF